MDNMSFHFGNIPHVELAATEIAKDTKVGELTRVEKLDS
jgi:hypothetical protein